VQNITLNDIQILNEGIRQLYSLHDLDTFAVQSLLVIDRLVQSEIPLFHVTDVHTGQIQDTFLPGYPGLTPELSRIKRLHLGEHPIAQNIHQALQGACKISDFANRQEFHNLDIYQEFFRPLATEDQMMLFLPNANSESWHPLTMDNIELVGFALARSQCSFTERDRILLNLLRPHLFQAYINAQKYQRLQQKSDRMSEIRLNTEGRVLWIGLQSLMWLEKYFPCPNYAGQFPDYLWAWVKDCVNSLGAYSPLKIQSKNQQLTIRLVVKGDENIYLLLLEEEALSLLDSLKILDLSQRETEVLAWVIQGKDNQSIATNLRIGIGTVRKHLENIYRKWQVSSRTEAIAKTLEELGFLQQ
jgi:DNA-binding CsgD family transcriptional regulator